MQLFLRFFLILSILFHIPIFAGMKEAKKAYAQKQFQKAIKLFTEYAKENPSDGEPFMFMGYIYESQKDFPSSMAMFRRAVELNLNPKQKKTSLLKIILFYHYHQSWDVVAHYSNRFLKLDPDNREISKMRDRAYANKGHDPGTLSLVKPDEQKTKQKKSSEENEKHLAEEKEQREKEKEREREREREKEIEREKIESLSEKRNSQNSEEKNWELSLKYFKLEDYQKADKIMQELLNQSPNNKNYLYKAGIAKLRLGEYEKAIKYFEASKKLTKEKDKMLLYYLNLNQGQAYQKLGNTNTAIELYYKAYQYNNSPIILPAIAKIQYENKSYEEAIKTSDQTLKSDPNNLEANMYKSLSLISLGRKKTGYKILLDFTKRINRLYPEINTVPEKFHDGILQIGMFYSNRIKYKLALKYLTVVSSTKSKSKRFNFSLGKTYFYTKKYDLAIVFLEKVPEIPAANYLLAKYYAKENNLIKCKDYLAKAGKKNEIYWIKVKLDSYFKELLKSPEFVAYIDAKGVVTIPAKTIIPPKVEESKIETKEIKIETKETKIETKVETKNTIEPPTEGVVPVKEQPAIQPETKSPENTVTPPPAKEESIQ